MSGKPLPTIIKSGPNGSGGQQQPTVIYRTGTNITMTQSGQTNTAATTTSNLLKPQLSTPSIAAGVNSQSQMSSGVPLSPVKVMSVVNSDTSKTVPAVLGGRMSLATPTGVGLSVGNNSSLPSTAPNNTPVSVITVNNKAILTNLANAAAASSGGNGRPTISVIGGPSSTSAGGTASALAQLQLPKVITPKKQIVTNVSIVNGRVQDAVGTVPSLQSEAPKLAASVLATSTRPVATAKTLDLLKPLDGKTASQMVETPSDASSQLPADSLSQPQRVQVVKNKLGLIEISGQKIGVVADDESIGNEDSSSSSEDEDGSSNSDSIGLTCRQPPLGAQESSPETPRAPPPKPDSILCCQGCGCYGIASEFFNETACSETCNVQIVQKNRERIKKERELQIQKQRREQRKKELAEAERAREEEEAKRLAKEKEAAEALAAAEKAAKEASREEEAAKVKDEANELDDGAAAVDADDDEAEDEGDEDEEECEGEGEDEDDVFSWGRYLDATNAKAAPIKLFSSGIPDRRNPFKVGMKLEAIDPEHPAIFCCVTVAEVKGYRLRLHFDGFVSSYDFWVNADSAEIFPAGWSHSQRQKLEAPPTFPTNSLPFTWKKYLSLNSAGTSVGHHRANSSSLAPKSCFKERPKVSTADTLGWSKGDKLEAVDKQNTSLICVATVTNVLEGRVLVHFDGWELDYDYWVKPDSCFLQPRGYCEKNGLSLNKPKGHRGEFKWDKYLAETGSKAVPESAFRNRATGGPAGSSTAASTTNGLFRRGMKLEAVDIRNPIHVRVCTVSEVSGRQLKVHYDGWPDEYDWWFDDDSPDIHPTSWCNKTGHPLMPPLTAKEIKRLEGKTECKTPGCGGLGHIKGHLHPTHSCLNDCPYSLRNIRSADSAIPDRLQTLSARTVPPSLGSGVRKRKRPKYLAESEGTDEPDEQVSAKISLTPNQPTNSSLHCENNSSASVTKRQVNVPNSIRREVFRPTHLNGDDEDFSSSCSASGGPSPEKRRKTPINWARNVQPLKNKLQQTRVHGLGSSGNGRGTMDRRRVETWTPRQVADFVASILTTQSAGSRLIEEEVDGESFLMLTQSDLIQHLGFRLGPAVKLANAILLIKSQGGDSNIFNHTPYRNHR